MKIIKFIIITLLFVSCSRTDTYKLIPYYESNKYDTTVYFTKYCVNGYYCYNDKNQKIKFTSPIKIILCDSASPYLEITTPGFFNPSVINYVYYTNDIDHVPDGVILSTEHLPGKQSTNKTNINPKN